MEKSELGRREPRLDDLLIMIDVVEEDVDRPDPLEAASLHEVPLGAVEDAGNEVEGNQPLGRAALGIDGKGDAGAREDLSRRVLLGEERLNREIVEKARKRGVSPPNLPVRRPHLV